jgi:AcrR family transcriptional regulator
MSASQEPKIDLRGEAQRRAAMVRRKRLLHAAIELYAAEGCDVPLEKIAERAQVGRATLYRNFPDRESLSTAVFQVHFDELKAQVERLGDRNDAFFRGVGALACQIVATSSLERVAPMYLHRPSFIRWVKLCIEDILAGPLKRAKASGLVREDFDISRVHMLLLMVAAGGMEDPGGDTKAGVERALQLLADGLTPHR